MSNPFLQQRQGLQVGQPSHAPTQCPSSHLTAQQTEAQDGTFNNKSDVKWTSYFSPPPKMESTLCWNQIIENLLKQESNS